MADKSVNSSNGLSTHGMHKATSWKPCEAVHVPLPPLLPLPSIPCISSQLTAAACQVAACTGLQDCEAPVRV